ncbi:MAG: Clp protease N-terminal domain-containing protein [Actinobacteria bacterium]|nr:Clp protease N-terminal domain-containing protein [Actinomycetota bacterium]
MDTEHVALGLLAHDLAPLGVDATAWLANIHLVWGLQRAGGYRAEPLPVLAVDQVGVSRRVQAVFDYAVDEAVANAHEDVEVRHVMVALLREGNGIAAGTLHDMGLRVGHLRRGAGLLPRPRVVAGGFAPPDGSEPTPAGPLVLMGGGPGTPTAQARVLAWTATRLGRPPRVVHAFVTMDGDRGDDAYIESVVASWLLAGAASADDAGVYDRADAFLPEVCERLEAADVVFVPGGFAERCSGGLGACGGLQPLLAPT